MIGEVVFHLIWITALGDFASLENKTSSKTPAATAAQGGNMHECLRPVDPKGFHKEDQEERITPLQSNSLEGTLCKTTRRSLEVDLSMWNGAKRNLTYVLLLDTKDANNLYN